MTQPRRELSDVTHRTTEVNGHIPTLLSTTNDVASITIERLGCQESRAFDLAYVSRTHSTSAQTSAYAKVTIGVIHRVGSAGAADKITEGGSVKES